MDNGQEKTVASFSRTLTRSEQNYCVIRKELLAVVKSMKYFHKLSVWPEACATPIIHKISSNLEQLFVPNNFAKRPNTH